MSMITDENGEGISYIKMDEFGNMRQDGEKIWWDYLPSCLTELFLACGCTRPDAGRYANNSRMAWSADERQRYWRVQQQANAGMVDAGNPMQRNMMPRDMMQIEDVDEARLHRQNILQQNNQQMGMQQSGMNGEPRRLFVLKDPNGAQQATDHLREGETYLVEDVDETPRNIHLHDGPSDTSREYSRNPGNEETLRLGAGPRDVALLDEQMRRPKRAGGEPGGTQYQDEGGGVSSRYVDGQSIGVTSRPEYYEDYTANEANYVHGQGEGMRHSGEGGAGGGRGGRGGERGGGERGGERGGGERGGGERGVGERVEGERGGGERDGGGGGGGERGGVGGEGGSGGERGGGGGVVGVDRRYVDDTIVPRLRIKSPDDDDMMDEIEEPARDNRGKSQARRHNKPDGSNDNDRDREVLGYVSSRTPLNYGYQHTKASILRYESNRGKLEEDQVRTGEKDPLYNTMRRNSLVQAEARRAAAYAAEDDSLETRRTLSHAALELKQRRDTVGITFDAPEELQRSDSVPNIKTKLDREASRSTYSRRGSLADNELLEQTHKFNRDDVKQRSNKSIRSRTDARSESNLPDDAKSQNISASAGEEMNPDALKALEAEMKKDTAAGDEASKAATDRSRKKRNQMTEKKSVFTIAFDDMQTKQLLPDSAGSDPL